MKGSAPLPRGLDGWVLSTQVTASRRSTRAPEAWMVGSGPHWGLDGWVLPAQATAPKLRPEPQGSGWMGPGSDGAWTVGPCQRRSLGRLLVRSQHKASPERVPTDNAVTAPLQQITSGCRGTGSGVSASNIHSERGSFMGQTGFNRGMLPRVQMPSGLTSTRFVFALAGHCTVNTLVHKLESVASPQAADRAALRKGQ